MQNILNSAGVPNGIAIILLLVLMVSIKRVPIHTIIEDRIFYAMVTCNLLQCAGEIISYCLEGKPGTIYLVTISVTNLTGLYTRTYMYQYIKSQTEIHSKQNLGGLCWI